MVCRLLKSLESACDEDRNRILNGPGHGVRGGGGVRWWVVACGLVARPFEVDRWVAEGGESGDVGGLGW